MLTVTEDLMLLAVHDEKGSLIFSASANLPYGLAGAILLDLIEKNKIQISNKKIILNDYSPTGNQYLDDVLILMKNKSKEVELKYWIQKIGNNITDIQKLVLESLVEKGVLKKSEQKLLWLIEFNRYPTLNPIPELETRKKIHDAVLRNEAPDPRTLSLVSLIYVCSLIDEVFNKEDRKDAKQTILKLMKNDDMSNEVQKVISDIIEAIGSSVVTTTTVGQSPSV